MICFVHSDACKDFGCQNLGGCDIVNGTAKCTCPPSFKGDKCQLDSKMKTFTCFFVKKINTFIKQSSNFFKSSIFS